MVIPPASVLTVMAHCDDAELWAGGTLARHAQAGAIVTTAVPRTNDIHNPDDIHPDHQRTAHILLAVLPEVVIATGHPRRVYTCDGYHNLHRYGRPLHLPVIVDVTSAWDTKMRALTQHASQPIAEHFAPMAETLGRLHGGRIGVRYSEPLAITQLLLLYHLLDSVR